jgi:hypothetical protein
MGRGALLGPEESGWVSSEVRTGFSGSLLCWDLCGFWCGGWLGPAFAILLVGFWVLGVVALVFGVLAVSGGCGWFSCPYFENCIVDASIFVVFVV